jgi:myosin heavy subunit
MPYKTGKLKGQLTTAEIRKLVKAHNKLTDIVIPPKSSRDDIIKIVNKAGYNIDHEKQLLKPRVEMQRKKTISLKKAETITKPKPKTELQKQKMAEKKAEKEEQEKKKVRAIKKEAIQEEKQRQKPVNKVENKSVEKKGLKDKKSNINKDTMTDTVFIKRQKALQSQKQKEVKRALLKSKAPVDKSTRRGKKLFNTLEEYEKQLKTVSEKYDEWFSKIRKTVYEDEKDLMKDREQLRVIGDERQKLYRFIDKARKDKKKKLDDEEKDKIYKKQLIGLQRLLSKYDKSMNISSEEVIKMQKFIKSNPKIIESQTYLIGYGNGVNRVIEALEESFNSKNQQMVRSIDMIGKIKGQEAEEYLKTVKNHKIKIDGKLLSFDEALKYIDDKGFKISKNQQKSLKDEYTSRGRSVTTSYDLSVMNNGNLRMTPNYKNLVEFGIPHDKKDYQVRSYYKDIAVNKLILKKK